MTNETTRGNARTDESSTDTGSNTAPTYHNQSFKENLLRADGGLDPTGLTEFQVQTLRAIADLGGAEYGLAIKRQLEAHYGEEINHGRLYPNLDKLVRWGLVEKGEIDARTNSYELTGAGIRVLEGRLDSLSQAIDAVHAERAVADGGRPSEEELLDVELVLGAGRQDDYQVRLDVSSSAVVDREEGRLELSLADGGMDEYLAELGLKSRTDEFATEPTESQEGA